MEICCPSPENSVITCRKKFVPLRYALYALMWGDVGSAIGRAYILAFSRGLCTLYLYGLTTWVMQHYTFAKSQSCVSAVVLKHSRF